jgi:hypothetical protein
VVKTRLDACVAAADTDPTMFRLRADFLARFGHMAAKEALVDDYQTAIRLAEDEDNCVKVRRSARGAVASTTVAQRSGLLGRTLSRFSGR